MGIPGSGKSTIACALYKSLRSSGYDIDMPRKSDYRRPRKSFLYFLRMDLLSLFYFFPYRVRRIYERWVATGSLRWSLKKGFTRSRYPAYLVDYIRRNGRKVFILEEWCQHQTSEEAVCSFDELALERYCAKLSDIDIPSIDVVYVLVETEIGKARVRIEGEGGCEREGFVDRFGGDSEELLRRWKNALEASVFQIEKSGKSVVYVCGSGDVSESVRKIRENIDRGVHLLGRGGSRRAS